MPISWSCASNSLFTALKRQEKADGRVWADRESRRPYLEKHDFAGLSLMARPGLEAGTPRFSGSRLVATVARKGPANRGYLRSTVSANGVAFGRLPARLGL